jgi:hypothetical protein
MAFKMKVTNDKLEGMDVFPAGQYDVKLISFKPSKASTGSINLNAMFEVVNHPEYSGRRLYDSLNEGFNVSRQDLAHCLGFPMETDGKESWLPGEWSGEENDPKTWKYTGPLLGQTGKVEVGIKTYNGKESNGIRRYFCAVPDCATKFPKIRHVTDLMKNG